MLVIRKPSPSIPHPIKILWKSKNKVKEKLHHSYTPSSPDGEFELFQTIQLTDHDTEDKNRVKRISFVQITVFTYATSEHICAHSALQLFFKLNMTFFTMVFLTKQCVLSFGFWQISSFHACIYFSQVLFLNSSTFTVILWKYCSFRTHSCNTCTI